MCLYFEDTATTAISTYCHHLYLHDALPICVREDQTMRSDVDLQLRGWRLTTAEIIYHMPDHPGVLQSFVWQLLDRPPQFPRLYAFLDFWAHNIDGTLHSVHVRSEEHTSELQSLMRISYAVFCLNKKTNVHTI